MSRFYLTANNSRGNRVTAAGHSSGQHAWLRGWCAGVRVDARASEEYPGRDAFHIYMTEGSNGDSWGTKLGTVEFVDGAPMFVPFVKSGKDN